MSIAFTAVSAAVFAGLGLVALAMGLLARTYSRPALGIGLVGLLALTTASTWMTLKGPGVDPPVIDRLQDEIAKRDQQIELLKNQPTQHEDDLGKKSKEREAAQLATEKAKNEANRLAAELQIERAKRAAAEAAQQDAQTRLTALEKQPPRLSSPTTGTKAVTNSLRDKFSTRLDTPFYSMEPLERRELVTGHVGSWYIIRLKISGQALTFQDRQFRIPGATGELIKCARNFQSEILGRLTTEAKSQRLFVRGSADARPVAGTTELPDAREFRVIARLADGTYSNDAKRQPLREPVQNEDLPQLRADWLLTKIQPIVQLSEPIGLLENTPVPGQERTAELILYVDWGNLL